MNRGWRLIVAAVLCGAGMSARSARAAGPDVPEDKSWAFTYDDHGFKPGSEIDLRSLNENVAGEHGTIRLSADKQSFLRGDGQPLRFWAVNAKLDCTPAEFDKHARFLASLGVNMARIFVNLPVNSATGKPGSEITFVDPKALDEVWRAEAAFKKCGIYSLIVPYWSAVVNPPASWDIGGGNGPEYDTHFLDFLAFPGGHPLFKWSCSKPEIMGMFPAAALIYRKGYIKAGTVPAIHEERSLADMWAEKAPLIAEDASFDPNRWAGKTGSEESNIPGGINPLAYLVGRVEVKYDGVPTRSTAVDFTKYIDTDRKIIHSLTGQITMDFGIGLCMVNAPKAIEAIGSLDKGGVMQLGEVTLKSGNDYGSITVVPLDDAPIASSGKVLVQVGTWGRPTGWTTQPWKLKGGRDAFRIVATGHMPERLINTDLTISVKNRHLTKAVLLDTAGYPVKTLDGKTDGGVFTLTLPADAMYVVLE